MATGTALTAALEYAARGWHVLQYRACTKHHLSNYFDHTIDPAKLRRWWAETPDANVAIATGAISGIISVDIDSMDGMLWWEQEMGEIDYHALMITHRGIHLFFQCSQRVPTFNLRPDIDVCADGGQSIMPPSIHPTGIPYVWGTGGIPDNLPLITSQLQRVIDAHDTP